MTRYFTHETWERERCYRQIGRAANRIDHIASNQFIKRGVESGDYVYPVTIMDGSLYLLGRLEVGKVCDTDEAVRVLGTTDLYEADDHIIAARSTSKYFDLEVPLGLTEVLTFISSKGNKQVKFSSPGRLDQQTLRSVRELHPESAAELDKLLSSTQ